MPEFKNISKRNISILHAGKKLNIPPGGCVDGPEMFSMYNGLKKMLKTDSYKKNTADITNSTEILNDLNRINNIVNYRKPLQTNINNVIKIKKFISVFNKTQKPSVALCLYGNDDITNKIKETVKYDNYKIYFNNYETVEDLKEDFIVIQDSSKLIQNDYISEIVKLGVISSVNIPKVYEVIEPDSQWVRQDVVKNYVERTECFISVVSLVNNTRQYMDLLDDLINQYTINKIEVVVAPNFTNLFSSCAEALNMLKDVSNGEVINYCHQDLKCPTTWIHGIITHVKQLDARKEKWGVLGMAGAYLNSNPRVEYNVLYLGGNFNSPNYTSSYRRLYGNKKEVQCVDELSLITKRTDEIRFDEKTFNHFHFYGADLCLQYLSKGYKNYAIDAECLHLSDGQSNMEKHRQVFIEQSIALYKKWEKTFKSWKTTTANFEVDKKTIIPLIFISINMRNKNKDYPQAIRVIN